MSNVLSSVQVQKEQIYICIHFPFEVASILHHSSYKVCYLKNGNGKPMNLKLLNVAALNCTVCTLELFALELYTIQLNTFELYTFELYTLELYCTPLICTFWNVHP